MNIDSVGMFNCQGQFMWVSRLLNGPREQLIGSRLWDWMNGEDRAVAERIWSNAIQNHERGSLRCTLHRQRDLDVEIDVCPVDSQSAPAAIAMLRVMPKGLDKLTIREREILVMYAKDLTTAEIAKELDIRERTVQTHRVNICQKLGVHTVAGMTKVAMQAGLVDFLSFPNGSELQAVG